MEVDFLRYEYKKEAIELMAPFIFRRECPIPTDGGMNRLDIDHATCSPVFPDSSGGWSDECEAIFSERCVTCPQLRFCCFSAGDGAVS